MFVILRAGTGLALLLAAFPAAAQPTSAPPAPAPATLTRAQGEDMVRSLFAQIDANHDGILDAAEQKTIIDAVTSNGAPPASVNAIRRMFTEGAAPNGKVTLDTFVRARMVAFDKADTNHDGKLDPAEQRASRAAQGME